MLVIFYMFIISLLISTQVLVLGAVAIWEDSLRLQSWMLFWYVCLMWIGNPAGCNAYMLSNPFFLLPRNLPLQVKPIG